MALVQESSTNGDKITTAVDPWDVTITIPSASARILLDLTGATNGGSGSGTRVLSSTLDPAGGNDALASLGEGFNGVTGCQAWVLKEADMPAASNYTLRVDLDAAHTGRRQSVVLSGADQSAGGVVVDTDSGTTGNRVCTLSGTFPVGTRVYGMCSGNGDNAWTVTGDATEIRDGLAESGGDNVVYAEGVLGTEQSTVTVTFASSGHARMGAIMVLVLPASGATLSQTKFRVYTESGSGLGETP